jgi:hypothetical protein
MNPYLEGLLALLTDERHPQEFRAVDAVNASFMRFSSALGPRATVDSNAAPSHDRDSVPWEGFVQSLVWLLSRNVT